MIKKMQRISAKFWAWYRNLSVKKRIVYTLLAFALPIMPGGSVNHVYFFMGSAGCPEVVAPIAGRFMRINPDKIKKGGLLCQDWGYTRWRDPIVFDNDLLSFAYVVNEFDQDAFKSNLHRYYALDPSGYYHGPMGLGIEVIDIDVGLGAIAVNDFSWQYFSHWPHYSTYFDPYVAIQLERGEHSLGDRRSLYYQITAHYSKDNKARGMRKLTTPYQQVDAIEITQAQLDYLRNDGGEPRRFIGPDAPDLSEAQLAYLKPRWAQMDTSDNVQREAGYFSHTLIARLWQSLGRYRWGGGKAFGRTIPAGSPDDPVPTLENVRSVDLTLPTDRCTIVICSPGISSGEAEGVDRSIPGTLGLYEYCPSAQDPRILRRSALLIRDASELMPAAYYVDRVPKLPLPKDQNVRIGWREILGDNNTVLGLKALPFRYFARFDADNRGSDENCSILEGATNPNPWRGELSDSIKGEANSSGNDIASVLMRFRHIEDDRYEAVIENTRSTRSSRKNTSAFSLGESPGSLALRGGLNYRHAIRMCTGSLKPYSPRLILGSLYEGDYFGIDGDVGGSVPIVYDFDQRRVEHHGKHYRQYTYRPGVPMAEILEFFEWEISSDHSQDCKSAYRQSGEPWAFVDGLTEDEKRNFSDYDGGTFWTELRDGKMPRILEAEEAAALIEQGILPSGPENLRFPRKYEYEREAGYDLEGYL